MIAIGSEELIPVHISFISYHNLSSFPFYPSATNFPLLFFCDFYIFFRLILIVRTDKLQSRPKYIFKKSGTNANFIYSVRFGALQHRILNINWSRSYKTLKSSEKKRWIRLTYWWFWNRDKKGNGQIFWERKTTIAS